MAALDFRGVDAQLLVEHGLKRVGYVVWKPEEGSRSDSPYSTPKDIKDGWRQSGVAMRPLLEWIHDVQTLKMTPTKMDPHMCAN
jgi:hypothetical protein